MAAWAAQRAPLAGQRVLELGSGGVEILSICFNGEVWASGVGRSFRFRILQS